MSRNLIQRVTWAPADYAANSSAQFAWARELIARLDLQGNERVLDVGCGDGKITAELASRLPHGEVIGVDNSSEMIRYAQVAFPSCAHLNLDFRVMDARHLRFEKPFDLVFSNAALHWVDDHASFLLGAAKCVRDGGRLVVSCGGKGNAQEVFAVLRSRMPLIKWRGFFRRMKAPYFFHRPEDYEKWLLRAGFRPLSIRLVPKDTAFNRESLAAWLRTTWLPYTQRVPEKLREEFIVSVVDRYVARHPPDAAGQTHVQMIRLELDATKADGTSAS